MLPKFGNFIVLYLILLTWLFNFDLTELKLCTKKDKPPKPPKPPKAKPSDYRGPIKILCRNPYQSFPIFEYNKGGNLDLTEWRTKIKGEEFGIYIVGYGDVNKLREYDAMAYNWARKKISTVCVVEHTEYNHGFFDSVKYRLPHVMDVVSELLLFFHENNLISIQKTIAAGFSLGAHMIGKAVEKVYLKLKFKVPLLIALDPCRFVPNKLRVTKEVADHVQGVNVSLISNFKRVGHVNFTLNNKSRNQPGCQTINLNCSHTYAVQLFQAMLTGKKIIGTNLRNKTKTCEFGIYNVQKESGDFDIKYVIDVTRYPIFASLVRYLMPNFVLGLIYR